MVQLCSMWDKKVRMSRKHSEASNLPHTGGNYQHPVHHGSRPVISSIFQAPALISHVKHGEDAELWLGGRAWV
jgi:hypothetical protein